VRTNGIAERIAELKAAQAKKSELSRDELREFLTELILTPAGKVNEQSRLCQSYKNTAEVLAAAFFLRKNDVPHPGRNAACSSGLAAA